MPEGLRRRDERSRRLAECKARLEAERDAARRAQEKKIRQREGPSPRGRIPKGLTATERMERKLRTKRGASLYKKRAQTVEPVFGQIKDTRALAGF